MTKLESVGKIKLGRPEWMLEKTSPLDRLPYSLFLPLRSLLPGESERQTTVGRYTIVYVSVPEGKKERKGERKRKRELNLRHQRSPWLRAWCCSLPLNLVLRLARSTLTHFLHGFTSTRRASTDTDKRYTLIFSHRDLDSPIAFLCSRYSMRRSAYTRLPPDIVSRILFSIESTEHLVDNKSLETL